MKSKKKQWMEFSKRVGQHIENYVIPQYGDYPDEMLENFDIQDYKSQLIRYHARIGTNARGPKESMRDCLKIAHYAGYLYDRLSEEL